MSMILRGLPICLVFALVIIGHAERAEAQTPVSVANSAAKYVDQSNGMTADEAVKSAIENNEQFLALLKEAESAERLIEQAEQRARMSVSANGLQQAIGKSHRYSIQTSIPLELGGRRNARVLVATQKAKIKRKRVEQGESEIATAVRRKFGETLALILRLELTEEMLNVTQNSYRLVQARVVEGKTAPLEENMLLVEVNRLRSARETDESKVQIALLELKNLIGLSVNTPLRLKGDLKDSLTNFPLLAELTERALQTRPDLELLRATVDLADAKTDKAKKDGKFDASATIGYQRLRISPAVQFNYVVFGMKIMLPHANKSRDAIEASVLESQAAEKRRDFAELSVRKEVANALIRYTSAVRAKEITRVGVVGQAENNLDVVRKTYEMGSRSLLDYIAEQRRYIDYKNGLIKAELAVYLARIEVYRATFAPELITK
ncbi:MAG: TolC family protein [Pyrinomonadaceae bacterium]|nr:TolC family protein [Pyrinomonadaceae bacterium]